MQNETLPKINCIIYSGSGCVNLCPKFNLFGWIGVIH